MSIDNTSHLILLGSKRERTQANILDFCLLQNFMSKPMKEILHIWVAIFGFGCKAVSKHLKRRLPDVAFILLAPIIFPGTPIVVINNQLA